MDSTLPLYRQLSSRFSCLALSFFLLLFIGFWLYFQHEQSLAAVKNQQLPTIEKYNQRQLRLIKQHHLINKILVVKYAEQFGDYYQSLTTNLKSISAVSDNHRRLLAQMVQRLQMQTENIHRLTQSSRRNIQLKENVINQLTLVIDSLSEVITEQARQQREQSRQITQGNLTARSTVIRAKALSQLIDRVTINRALHQSLVETLAMFNQLDLQYDLVKFDYIQQQAQDSISDWLAPFNDSDSFSNINENGLFEQTIVLNGLLFNEQNTFAKWRGQLRRAKDFQTELIKQKAELVPLLEQTLVVQPPTASLIETALSNGLAKLSIPFQSKYYIWSVTATFVVLAIIFVGLLVNIRRTIKCFGRQSTVVITELVNKGQVLSAIPGREIAEIINTVNQLSRPEHSDAEYAQQQQRYQTQTAAMSRQSGHIFWQLSELSKQKQALCDLLAVKNNNQHWRRCFSRTDVRAILLIARQAQKHNSVEKISLISQQGKAILLTVEYVSGQWCGSLCNAEDYRVLNDENIQLKQQLHQQGQADKLAIITRCEDELSLINNAMVQRQKLSLAQGDEQLAYQQLQQLVFRNEQQKTSAQLRRDDFMLMLSTVKIANEIQNALVNVSLKQVHSNNSIYLSLGSNLASMVTLESTLFQAMIGTICQQILHAQRGVELAVDMQVIDVNSAQQIVRLSFQVNNPSQVNKLSQVLNALANDDETRGDFDRPSLHYLSDLQLIFNVTNKVNQPLELAGKFSFEMPLTIAEDSSEARKNKAARLEKYNLLVIATNKFRQQNICYQLKDSKAVIETMHDMSLFQRQLSVKNLAQHRIDGIILSTEVYRSDYDLITQHLSTLPAKIQPKLLVIQPFYDSVLQRAGLFTVSDLPWITGELVTCIAELLDAAKRQNVLIEPELFLPYRFLPTQVEVVLAVARVSKHQPLLRILQWFGLQVTVVSQQESLEQLWKSGRYLVAITEFFPFKVDIEASVSSVRGIFALTNNADERQDDLSKLAIEKSWHSSYLAATLDINKLIQQLSPWLKLDVNSTENNNVGGAQHQHSSEEAHNTTRQNASLVKDDVALAPEINMAEIDQSLDFTVKVQQEHKTANGAFDLAVYADNQGSAALAAFMLDEYLADINVKILALEASLKQQDYPVALQLLPSLTTLAKVIAAQPLLKQCIALTALLNQAMADKSAKRVLSSKKKEQLQQQLNQLTLCLVQITEYAETI